MLIFKETPVWVFASCQSISSHQFLSTPPSDRRRFLWQTIYHTTIPILAPLYPIAGGAQMRGINPHPIFPNMPVFNTSELLRLYHHRLWGRVGCGFAYCVAITVAAPNQPPFEKTIGVRHSSIPLGNPMSYYPTQDFPLLSVVTMYGQRPELWDVFR
jgi:hypothetical protein